MEPQFNAGQMLLHMDRPAFCVLDGVIKAANKAALDRMIPVEQPVASLLADSQEEFESFTDGILSLTLQVGDARYIASVHPIAPYHLFTLEPENTESELRALALAAQKLREPLARIMTITEHLFPELEPEDGSPAADQMARINQGLYQMLRIVGNMSDTARYAAGTPRMETRDVDAVLRELFEQAGTLCGFSGVRVEYTGLPNPVYSLIDSEQIERSVYNILSNCLKFTPAGGSIQAKLTHRNSKLHLTIQDTGAKLTPEMVSGFYNRFLREPAIESANQGIGLGLKLIYSCASAHGGTVLLAPAGERGLRLTMSLPIRLDGALHSPAMRIDYAGERNHGLIELADSLPHALYKPSKKH